MRTGFSHCVVESIRSKKEATKIKINIRRAFEWPLEKIFFISTHRYFHYSRKNYINLSF